MISPEVERRLWAEHYTKYEGVARLIGVEGLRRSILSGIASEESIKEALASGDKHLNSIPLRKWDAMANFMGRPSREKLNTVGVPFWSQSTGVCALKHVARYYIGNAEPPTK